MKTSVIGIVLALVALAGPARGQNYVFGPNVRVNDDPPGRNGHAIGSPGQRNCAFRGDTVYLVWDDDRNADYYHVWFARSTNGGLSFGSNIRLADGDASWTPSLAVDDSGRIHVVLWARDASMQFGIWYATSRDGGQHFSSPLALCDTHCYDVAPSIAVSSDGARIYIVRERGPYQQYDLILSRSTDGGATFALPEARINQDIDRGAQGPSIAVFDDTIVLVAWDGYMGAHVARSTDGGSTFGPSILLDDTAAGDTGSSGPSIMAQSTGTSYVAFPVHGKGVRLAVSRDSGRTYSLGQPTTPGMGPQTASVWARAGGSVYIASSCQTPNSYITFTHSTDGGRSFSPAVDPFDGQHQYLDLFDCATVTASPDGRVFVAWVDNRNSLPGWNDDVYCAVGRPAAIQETDSEALPESRLRISPNPSRGLVRIECALQRTGMREASIFDLSGRCVRLLSPCPASAGNRAIYWNGTDASGQRVSPGIYFVRVETAEGSLRARIEYLGGG